MLNIKNATKSFDEIHAVDGLSFSISDGQIFGLLGPNGSGKTTMIRMIMGILAPDSGEISLNGSGITEDDRHRIGFLPEERGIYQKTKLTETLLYLATLRGGNREKVKIRIDEYLERFDLTDYAQKKIETLSKGNQQKVQFILTLLTKPEMLILDEPFSGLDPVNQILMKEILRDEKERGTTILLSTHQMEQVERICDDICLIDHGKTVLEGNLRKIKKEHGTQEIRLQFQGELSKSLEGFIVTKEENGAVFGVLQDGKTINSIVEQLTQQVEIISVETLEPTLEQIFIETVGESA